MEESESNMSEMMIRKASRKGVRPLIGLFSESGCGKTYSSLLLARGFVGKEGKIAMIDSESGRGELYADVIPGGYDVLALDPPFSPARYIEALQSVAKAGYAIAVVDSVSHEWEGQGGVLDMAAASEERSGKAGLHNWKTPKMEHAKMLLSLLQSPLPVIVCMRAKYKTRQGKDGGKTVIIKDDYTSPIQAEDFIYEMTIHGEIMPDHSFRLTKASHPALKECFPVNKPISIEHGEKLAEWCAAPGGETKTEKREEKSENAGKNDVKKKLWTATKSIHGGSKEKLRQWLVGNGIILDDVVLENLTSDALSEVLSKAIIVMKENEQNG